MQPCSKPLDFDSRLAGSVKPYEWWFLLEYSDPEADDWPSHAVDEALKASQLADGLRHLMQLKPRGRILFIRQRSRDTAQPKQFFMCNPQAQALYGVALKSYDDLTQVTINDGMPKMTDQPMAEVTQPLYLVCTNGNRDCRCWDFGQPVYAALRDAVGTSVWETTHIGGHKYAATLYVYPQAICYGRLTVDDVQPLVSAQECGELLVEKYRGRSQVAQPIQAAEHYLLTTYHCSGIDDFVLAGTLRQGNEIIVWAQLKGHEAEVHQLRIATDEHGLFVAGHDRFAKQG